jgi:hypothetical protein
MNCEELIRYLSDYIDNDLSLDLRADAREHLATCKNCHVMLDTTRLTIALYRTRGEQSLPPVRRAGLFARLKEAVAERDDCEV